MTARYSRSANAKLAFTTDSYVVKTAVLSRRGHWVAGGEWDSERSGDVRRAAALSEMRHDPGRGFADGDAVGGGAEFEEVGGSWRACNWSRAIPRSSIRARATEFS